ncbi:hypothetical protein ACJ73_07772 [Blastomyces percursus]|uniref:Uncharacterized protein n=1 Tax=Blastomyces percursus TaxID=1658174 RepID=A0A1J9PYA8_9EURO|nr:hypothetical protein ACJ73_07772 [Blastomyces percursus]
MNALNSPSSLPEHEPLTTYTIIDYGPSGKGQARSVVAEWSIYNKISLVARSTRQKYEFEEGSVLPELRGPAFLARELETYGLGLHMIPFRDFDSANQTMSYILLVAVYSKECSDTTHDCQPHSVKLLEKTIAAAPTFLGPMVEAGLSEHGPWNGDIRQLALKISAEPVTRCYFKHDYGPLVCPMVKERLAIVETFLRKISTSRVDWESVAHMLGKACIDLKIAHEVSNNIQLTLGRMKVSGNKSKDYLLPLQSLASGPEKLGGSFY